EDPTGLAAQGAIDPCRQPSTHDKAGAVECNAVEWMTLLADEDGARETARERGENAAGGAAVEDRRVAEGEGHGHLGGTGAGSAGLECQGKEPHAHGGR